MSILSPAVRDGFRAFTVQFENDVPTMYQDILGLVTVGDGNLIDPMREALRLTWYKPDGTVASVAEVIADWHRVKSMTKAMVWRRYQSPACLHLSEDGIAALVLARLDANAEILAHTFPEFAMFHEAAQTAILSMAWAMGAGFTAKWPHFSAAVRAQNWTACAANDEIHSAVDAARGIPANPGVIPRNKADRALFLIASGMSEEQARDAAGLPASFVLPSFAGPETPAEDATTG